MLSGAGATRRYTREHFVKAAAAIFFKLYQNDRDNGLPPPTRRSCRRANLLNAGTTTYTYDAL